MLTIAQVGLRGFGKIHLERAARLAGLGRVEVVAGCRSNGQDYGFPCYENLGEVLSHRDNIDIVSIASPIDTHFAFAAQALDYGAHIFLEKPPVASLDQFRELEGLADKAGKAIQVGFQSLGSAGINRMKELAATELGEIRSVQVWGMWLRTTGYFQRARWAGKRVLDGVRVADGVCTNALAHSIATACRIVDLVSLDQIESVETELYHCFNTESDDTSWVKIRRNDGVPIDVSLTLCGPTQENPTVTLVGSRGRAQFQYTEDVIIWYNGGAPHVEHVARTDLLENLVDHIEKHVPLLVPLAQNAGFMSVLEATQSAPEPMQIQPEHMVWHGEGADSHPVPDGIETFQRTCLGEGIGYADAQAPWGDSAAKAVWKPR
ncbi:MAG: Gfo/Idh/MocA family oxidoreductase [Propionibacteriaceae bacterium]|jgi:predicted dehydrogenase|nr:Gfo/Idh/MocA family oxidoreductase [Propionibacteriaceae bacterium]